MPLPTNWNAIALNTAPNSANEIHGDQVARDFGFKGGLVPGVTIAAYLIHPAVEAWGELFLEHGYAHVRVGSPLYHEELFEVQLSDPGENRYSAELIKSDQQVSANGEVGILLTPATPPERRFDSIAATDFVGPAATPERWQLLHENGCQAFAFRWGPKATMQSYMADPNKMPALLRGDTPFANMSFLLGLSNWVLAGNAHMNPWVHLETWSQNYGPVPWNTLVVAEMQVKAFYERKGHKFVDVDVALFNDDDNTCVGTISLRAIYQLRGFV